MILYKKSLTNGMKTRALKQIPITIDDSLDFNHPKLSTERDRVKYIKKCESIIRRSDEYKSYIKFLKENLDMHRCMILRNLANIEGKRYSIEVHHEPFTLFDIVDVVINKRTDSEMSLHELDIADEVMGLHYDNNVGLVPLSTTMHEAVHSDLIFIPLQFIYQNYAKFFEEYEPFFNERLINKITAKADLSVTMTTPASSHLSVNFTYVDIEGCVLPEIPPEWKNVMKVDMVIPKD